jgi:hypothetical protein
MRADAVLLLGAPIKVVVHDVGHHFTSGGSGSGIQCVHRHHPSAAHLARLCAVIAAPVLGGSAPWYIAIVPPDQQLCRRQSPARELPHLAVARLLVSIRSLRHPFASLKNKRKTYRFCHVFDTRKTAYAGK